MSLSTLIVQREIASIREVEEALARQVLYGGDLVTNLLEVCRIDEAQLLPIVAESLGLLPAPPGELPRPDEEAKRLVAAEVAVERNLAPLSVDRYGLVIAVAAPLSADVEQELAFALALPISQKVAPLVRIKQALARDYGAPLDRRLQRLLQRMMTDGPRGFSSFPPMRNADLRMGAPRPPSVLPPAPHSKPPPAIRPSVPPGGGPHTLVRQTEMPPARAQRRRRGAITVEVARNELEEAIERDTIFDLTFEFARQYFDYTAVFIVHGELAEGRDAFGDGAARDKVARIGVPLDLPSLLSEARGKKAVVQRVPSSEGLDAVLMGDLGRPGRTMCVVLPIVVRTRVVAMLLGDGGDTGIDLATLKDVEGIVTQATAAFERLIVRKKLKGSAPPAGLGLSSPPNERASLAPLTKLSEAHRPAVEELAPPIRDLMTEPVSRVGETMREPIVKSFVPENELGKKLVGKSDVPPPPNVLAVRRPSGRPIPREEPRTNPEMPAVMSGSVMSGPMSGLPKSRRRGEAPKLDFGAVPPPSSSFGSEQFGADEIERKLLAEIHGRSLEHEPLTSRDPEPRPVVSPSQIPSAVSSSSPLSSEVEAPHSPKAESPRAQPVASRVHVVTDMSPGALPMFPSASPAPQPVDDVSAPAVPAPASSPVSSESSEFGAISALDALSEPPPSAPISSVLVSTDDGDVHVIDPYADRTPFAPPVDMTPPPAEVEPAPADSERTDIDVEPPVAVAPPAVMPRMPPVPPSRAMPASEQQISVAAHRPPSSRSDHSRVLPSVIVDVASEYVGLVDRVLEAAEAQIAGGEAGQADDAEAALVRAGGYAMPAIMARFPGPITFEKDRLETGPLPRVAECGAILRVIASQRRTALPFVLSHVEDQDVEKRFWATYLLTELVYPDVLDPILVRVFDEEARVRRVARAAARAFAEAHPQTIVERLELIAMDGGESRERRSLAVETLGETREALAVPALVPLLDDPDPRVASAVRAALTVIARQDLGATSTKWQAWWNENKERHRLEWLIDSLMHEQAAIRAAAGEELKTITKEYFGYYDDLPKRERERAQSRYREWWNSVGRVRFSRSASSRG